MVQFPLCVYFDVRIIDRYNPIALKLQISQMKCKAGALSQNRIEKYVLYGLVCFESIE